MEDQIIPENINLFLIQSIKEITNPPSEKDFKGLNFSVHFDMMHNLEREIVRIRLYLVMSEQKEKAILEEVGNYETDFIFKIEKLANHYQIIENKPIFAGNFVGTILGISYSTLRGMLLTSWKNTAYEDVILPIISVQKLLDQVKPH